MILPQQADEDEAYRRYYQAQRGYKILDNGAAEGTPASFDDILRIAYELQVDEVVCPDVMGHCDATLEYSRTFVDFVRGSYPQAFGDFKFGVVLQGKSMSEVLKCYNGFGYFQWFEECSVCYIPRILANNIQRNFRINFMEAIEQGAVDRHFEEFHALGGTHHLKEVVTLADTTIRGIDTSQPAVLAHHGYSLREDANSRARKPDFFQATLDHELLKDNIELYLSWAS